MIGGCLVRGEIKENCLCFKICLLKVVSPQKNIMQLLIAVIIVDNLYSLINCLTYQRAKRTSVLVDFIIFSKYMMVHCTSTVAHITLLRGESIDMQ